MGFKIVDMGKSGTYLANMLFRTLNIILKQQRIYIYIGVRAVREDICSKDEFQLT
jgi:hypothetical protein